MDRKTTNIAGCSIGFMNMLVAPAYTELIKVIPEAQCCLDNLEENKDKWEERKEEFKQKMEKGENYIAESKGIIQEPKEASKSSKNIGTIKISDGMSGANSLMNTGGFQWQVSENQ